MKKLHCDRGETLIEVLASILIAALSVTLLFSCVMASSNMDREARKLDVKHYEALTAAEGQRVSLGESQVTITQVVIDGGYAEAAGVPVNLYGGAGLYSYSKKVTP